jgi:hypothetical protein
MVCVQMLPSEPTLNVKAVMVSSSGGIDGKNSVESAQRPVDFFDADAKIRPSTNQGPGSFRRLANLTDTSDQ